LADKINRRHLKNVWGLLLRPSFLRSILIGHKKQTITLVIQIKKGLVVELKNTSSEVKCLPPSLHITDNITNSYIQITQLLSNYIHNIYF